MSNFPPLSKEEKQLRDSIVLSRLKEELEFFSVPDGTIQKLDDIRTELQPYLKSENRMEVAIATDIYQRIGDVRFIFNLLSND